ncbi:MAG: translation elongation factor Ts [Planctomycetota bacterium]
MAISASMVRELREATGAAMMDCKKALEATGGDLDASIDHLRKQGLKSAAKKSGRETAEGRTFAVLSEDARRGHLVAVACETDFLSKGEDFKDFMGQLETHVAEHDPKSVDDLMAQSWQGGDQTVAARVQEAVGHFGENIQVVHLARLENPNGLVGAYVHHDYKQGAIASVTTSADAATGAGPLRSLCQHITVFSPAYANTDSVPAEDAAREEAVLRESDDMKSKPAEVQDKMIVGRMKKFYAERCLSEQAWMLDDKQTVTKALASALGGDVKVEAFSLIKLG